MALLYKCLTLFRLPPGTLLQMPRRERAFVYACAELYENGDMEL